MSNSRLDRGNGEAWFGAPDAGTGRTAGWTTQAAWLLACLAALLAARIAALHFNATDLFFDEAQYWSWSLDPAFGYYSKPPLIAWIIGLGTALCGTSEFCVRLPSPILHTATALMVFAAASRLYDPKTGFWSGLVFASLPGVSFSSGLISTDVPLLLFWAVALYALIALIQDRTALWPGLLLGLAFGLGLNAKYAMAYFVLCTLVYAGATPEHRWILRDRRWWLSVAIAVAMILPNLLWNLENSFSTFAHTADNAKWGGALFHPDKAIEFIGAQFGVFGPILFGALLAICWRAYHRGLPPPDRLLLAFAIPVIAIITVQALVSRAHANWAAVSYVSASMLVTATMMREANWKWLGASLGLHLLIVPTLAFGLANARTLALPSPKNPFARTLGWAAIARETSERLDRAKAAGKPFVAILTRDRSVTAELIYYMRNQSTPILAWPPHGRPKDHYQLTRPLTDTVSGPLLLVSLRPAPGDVLERFRAVGPAETIPVRAGEGASRTVHFRRLEGFRGRPPRFPIPK